MNEEKYLLSHISVTKSIVVALRNCPHVSQLALTDSVAAGIYHHQPPNTTHAPFKMSPPSWTTR